MLNRFLKLNKETLLSLITKISAAMWLISIVGVFTILGYVAVIKKQMFDNVPHIFALLLFGFIFLGCCAFIIGTISLTAQLITKRSHKKQNLCVFLVTLFIAYALLPLYLLIYIFKPLEFIKQIKHNGIKELFRKFNIKAFVTNIIALVLVVVFILPIWIGGYVIVGVTIKKSLGYGTEIITIAGTGSMFPTFPKGEGKDQKKLAKQIVATAGMIPYPNGLVIAGKRYFGYEIARGDIVSIENDKIREMTKQVYGTPSGWIKRVIALAHDNIELRGGIVYLNGKPLKEPYTAQARSTFGGTFLSECKKVTVPKDHIFVMGDNRKGSGDSREIGFIEISAINYVLPLKNQIGTLDKHWRNTNNDFDEISKIKLDKNKYVDLLNKKRKEMGVKPLKYQNKLELSAQKRTEVMLKFNDFSFEATKSGYTMTKAMKDVNYSNIVWGEITTQGYYDEDELIDNQFQFPESKTFLTDKTFQEIGIAQVEGTINGCPAQVIVQHLAGYVPPNYKKEHIDGWKNMLERLKEIQPSWERLKEFREFYEQNKQDVDRINEIITIRIANISAIVSRMEANQWFTYAEQQMIDQDESLSEEQEAIAKMLNSKN